MALVHCSQLLRRPLTVAGTSKSSESDLYPQAGVLCMCVVRLSVILHQQSRLNQGRSSAGCLYSHDSRVSSLSKLNQVMSLVTATTARYFAGALQKGGDYATETGQPIQRHHRGTI